MHEESAVRVLIADDQLAELMTLRRMAVWYPATRFILHKEARNGMEALHLLKEGNVDILITDIRMPIMDGLTLLQEVATRYPDVPVVLHSGFADFEYARKGLVLGAFDYILKPVSTGTLLNVLERAATAIISSREAHEAHPEDAAAFLCREIRAGRALSKKQILMYMQCLKSENASMGNDDSQWIKEGIDSIAKQLSTVVLDLTKFDMVSYATAWVMGRCHHAAAFVWLVRFVEKAYCEMYLPRIAHDLVRKTVKIVLTENGIPKSVGNVADALYVHRNHLSQTFSRETGITLSEYILRAKMYAARVLLLNPGRSIHETAALLGYEDEQHFSKRYRQHTGLLPREYIKYMEHA